MLEKSPGTRQTPHSTDTFFRTWSALEKEEDPTPAVEE